MNREATTNAPLSGMAAATSATATGQAPTDDLVLAAGPDEVRYRPEDALSACIGYAFMSENAAIGRRGDVAGVTEPVPRYGYYAYDCVRPSPPGHVAFVDVLVADALNGRMLHPAIVRLHAAGRRAEPHLIRALHAVRADTAFWTLPVEALDAESTHPIGSALTAAWQELMATAKVDIALTHKYLHHRQPAFFPLIDRLTREALATSTVRMAGGGLWQAVHTDLTAAKETWDWLEDAFEREATARGGVRLTRLRLHDILLWLHLSIADRSTATTHRKQAIEGGRQILDGFLGVAFHFPRTPVEDA